jgi:uracil-DNA glycosylase
MINKSSPELNQLSQQIRECRLCEAHLPLEPKPVFRVSSTAKLLIVGQAPSAMVQGNGELWSDASGMRLRQWLGMDRHRFNQQADIAAVPMGFCYPGRGRLGNLPPRPECSQTWHPQLFPLLTEVKLILLVGHYAHAYFLGEQRKKSLTETVQAFAEYAPRYFPLPHPNPGNTIWFNQNPWFELDVLPELKKQVAQVFV